MTFKSYGVSLTLSTLAFLSIVTLNVTSTATRPTSAIVDDLNGTIRIRAGTGQPTLIQRYAEFPASTALLVPGTRRGSTEHWAHLRFRNSSSRSVTLVQAGTDPTDSEYRFPCEYQRGTGVWGVRQVGSNACERITINGGGWRSQLNSTTLAQKSADPQLAQQPPEQFFITPANTLTLLYIYQTADSTIVNVLAGSATIRTASGSLIARAGIRYTDYGDGTRGETSAIPDEIYTARAVQIFLEPVNWSEDLGTQIGEFQTAVEQTRLEASPPASVDPSPIYDPGVPSPRPERPSPRPQPSSTPETPYPQPQPSSPTPTPTPSSPNGPYYPPIR